MYYRCFSTVHIHTGKGKLKSCSLKSKQKFETVMRIDIIFLGFGDPGEMPSISGLLKCINENIL